MKYIEYINKLTVQECNPMSYPNAEFLGHSYHELSKQAHSIKNYRHYLIKPNEKRQSEVYIRWGFCVKCNNLRYHEVVEIDNAENNSYGRVLVEGGEIQENPTYEAWKEANRV